MATSNPTRAGISPRPTINERNSLLICTGPSFSTIHPGGEHPTTWERFNRIAHQRCVNRLKMTAASGFTAVFSRDEEKKGRWRIRQKSAT
jgi:hypothetical protein